jgi:predicted alpha/beta hydrolase
MKTLKILTCSVVFLAAIVYLAVTISKKPQPPKQIYWEGSAETDRQMREWRREWEENSAKKEEIDNRIRRKYQ